MISRVLIPFASLVFAMHLHAQVAPAPAVSATEREAARKKAIEIATQVPKDMGLLERTSYVSIPVDRNDPAGVLEDSDIKPFIPPIMITADLIMVLFVPVKRDASPTVAVYVDARLGVVRGYLIGPKERTR